MIVRKLCCVSVVGVLLLLGNIAFAEITETPYDQADFLGDDAQCGLCHPDIYNDYALSGHRYKLTYIGGVEPAADTWPHTPVPPLPDIVGTWDQVSYVIGNFFWKARFIDPNGYIWTGDAVQWNVADEEWVAYHSSDPVGTKPFDCGRCHTTGYKQAGNQGGLPGMSGTFTEPGVRCEACHGAAKAHAQSIGATLPPGGQDCDECHYRDADFRMPWSGGFMRHHQQAEDLSHSPHASFECTICHDPHKSVVYDLGGTIAECTDCHDAAEHTLPDGMAHLECVDCHMTKMGKSAAATGPYSADVRTHLFRIMTDPIAAADNVTDGFWNQDADGKAWITLDYACLSCHDGEEAFELTLEGAARAAVTIHTPEVPPAVDLAVDVTVNGQDNFDVVGSGDNVSVDLGVLAGDSVDVPADWFIVASTNWGWYYWDPLYGWQPGLYPSLVDFAVFDVDPAYNVYDGTLFPGYYTFWFGVFADDGATALDTVPLYVLP